MKVKEFKELGFIVVATIPENFIRFIFEDEPAYQEIQMFARNAFEERNNKHCDYYEKVEKFCAHKGYTLSCIEYNGVGNDATFVKVSAIKEVKGYRVVVRKKDFCLSLYTDETKEEIFRVEETFSYFNYFVGKTSRIQYARHELFEGAAINPKYVIESIIGDREFNIKHIKNHYNSELKKIREEYKENLKRAKKGLNTIKKLLGE